MLLRLLATCILAFGGAWASQCAGDASGSPSSNSTLFAPLMEPADASRVLADHYIVVLKPPLVASHGPSLSGDGTGDPYPNAGLFSHDLWLNARMHSDGRSKVKHHYNLGSFRGYSGSFSKELIDDIRQRPEVAYVEADQVMHVMNASYLRPRDTYGLRLTREPVSGPKADPSEYANGDRLEGALASFVLNWLSPKSKKSASKMEMQNDAPWGLSRVSHRDMPGDGDRSYEYPQSAGKGVDVYIIDTGINIGHRDFGGRAKWGKTIPLDDKDIDGNGHGTHCAGIIGSSTYGMAKNATLIAVKVLSTSGFGSNADVIKGVEWVTKEHQRRAERAKLRGIEPPRSVANMSLGGGRSLTLENAVDRAVEAGIHFSVAAGNDSEDACEYSPAAAKRPITVGASTIEDAMAFFSNHGSCVDIFAPGLDITSTWTGSPDALNTISGTSMASPHVAGVLALYLGERAYDTDTLKELLLRDAAAGKLSLLPPSTENRLLCTRPLLLTL